MTQVLPQNTHLVIRPADYRDLDAVERLCAEDVEADSVTFSIDPEKPFKRLRSRSWHGLLRVLSLLLHPSQHLFCAYLAEQSSIKGMIRVSPFNRTRSAWRVDHVAVDAQPPSSDETVASDATKLSHLSLADVGSQLLRHCFEKIWEARTWLLEIDVNDKEALGLYRQNGFQPLAQMTYWSIAPELLQEIAEREPDLPNLLPVSNADAQLLYQLDTAAMPPLVRQVFDRHVLDFKTSLLGSLIGGVKTWLNHTEVVSGYVFESQRKAAIGYFQMRLCRDGSQPHRTQLTVHPAYTWLYPELLSQMARIAQDVPAQALQLASSDYQPEREEYLERLGAQRIAHTLMMSRSVWHKLRESKLPTLEGLQLAEVLQGFKPARKPVPSRITLMRSPANPSKPEPIEAPSPARPTNVASDGTRSSNPLLNLPSSTDFSEPPQEGPCC